MKSLSAICWWALAIIFFTETVKSTSNTDVDDTNYRLPNETYPEHYSIELTTNVHLGERAFNGEVTIDIVVVSNTSKIVLHAGKFEISKAAIVNPFSGESEDLSMDHESRREFLILTRTSGEKFPAKTKWKLRIIYSGELRDDKVGFHLSDYLHYDDDDNYQLKNFAATNFKTAYARHAFPCYDEPSKRANFTITINHNSTYRAISNMPVNSNLSRAGQTVFLTTPSMPTYSVAFIVCDFEYTEVKYKNLPQRMYSTSTAKDLRDGFLTITKQIMNYVSDYFDVEYMLPKIDHVAVENFRDEATATWGLIIYDLNNLPYEIQTDLSDDFDTVKFMAKAIIQQWFGNYVTISSWAYFWITEGIAELYSIKALDHIYPDGNAWDKYEMNFFRHPLYDESDSTSVLLTNHSQTPKEIDKQFYYKSTFILRMWKNALTDKVFQKGLRNFLKKNQYKAVGENELFNALQSAVEEENYHLPATVNEMISTWTNQKGYPILTVSRNYSDGTFTIKQETYNFNSSIKDSQTWYVPINYAVASNPDFSDTKATHYLRNVTKTIFTDVKISNNDWLILDKEAFGYYRVNYDLTNWNLIIESLIKDPFVIHKRKRAQLIRDAIQLFQSGRLDVSVVFKLFAYLKLGEDYSYLNELINFFNSVKRHWYTNEKYDDFKFFFAEQIRPIYEKLQLVDESRDNYLYNDIDIYQSVEDMACDTDVSKCLEPYYNGLKDAIKKNITLTSYELTCNAIKMSDDELFNTLYQKLIDNEDMISKTKLWESLVCHKNVTFFKKILKIAIDKSIDLEDDDRTNILKNSCHKSAMTFSACIEFLNENWDAYSSLEKDSLYDIISLMAENVTDKNQEDQLLALVNNIYNSRTTEMKIKEIISRSLENKRKYVAELRPSVPEYRGKPMQSASGLKSSKVWFLITAIGLFLYR